jgi:TP901 family phage tail tape measure protein
MAFDAGTILGRLKLDSGGFAAGILNAQGLTSLLGNSISTFLANPLLGVANMAKGAFGAITNLVTGTAEAADKFGKLAQATGASVEFLSGLKHAGEMSGVSFDALSVAMGKVAKGVDDATKGTGPAAEAFGQLGISVRNADGSLKDVQQLFLESADGLARIDNATLRAATAQKIFGESAGQMIPLLSQGSDGISALVDEAKRLGLTFDETAAQSAERFNDSLARIKGAFAGLAQQVAIPIFDALAPAMETIASTLGDTLGPILQTVAGMFAEFSPAIASLAGTLGEALMPILSAVAEIFSALMPLLAPILKLVGELAKAVAGTLAPALQVLAPILALIGKLLIPIVEAITKIVETLSDAGGWILDKLGLGGGGSSRGSGDTTVNVEVSPEDSAEAVARKLAPAIAGGVRGVQHRVEQSTVNRISLHDFETGLVLR